MQLVDDAEGSKTKREYELARVPVGGALAGQVVDFMGRLHGSPYQIGLDKQLPLLNEQLDMGSREQINEPLLTGVKASKQLLTYIALCYVACATLAVLMLLC